MSFPQPTGYLDDFVAFDTETTGLDENTDKIIELSAVRVRRGDVVERFEQFVHPGMAIPTAITKLTGITDAMVKDAPPIAEALRDFYRFIGGDRLVAHNAQFDIRFVAAAAEKSHLSAFRPQYEDTVELSRFVVPTLTNHKLETVAEYYGYDGFEAHRAIADAEAAAYIFQSVKLDLFAWPLRVIQDAQMLVNGLRDGYEALIGAAARAAFERGKHAPILPKTKPEMLNRLDNYIGPPILHNEPLALPDEIEIPEAAIDGIFGEEGTLAKRLPNYEPRSQQAEMAYMVQQALESEQYLPIEAGTGTGKSLAYLVPGILWSLAHAGRVIVSTNTKNLQEQLFFKDLPFLRQHIGYPFIMSLLKGRSNYLCLYKYYQALSEAPATGGAKDRLPLLSLIRWVAETNSGDLQENTSFIQKPTYIINRVAGEANFCLGNKCQYFTPCYIFRARRQAQSSHVVVGNHSLVFSDLTAENALLGEYDKIVFDEAHNLEKVAADFLGGSFTYYTIFTIVRNLYDRNEFGKEVGVVHQLKRKLAGLPIDQGRKQELDALLTRLSQASEEAGRANEEFFATLLSRAGRDERCRNQQYTAKIRLKQDDPIMVGVEPQAQLLGESVLSIINGLNRLGQVMAKITAAELPDREELGEQFEARLADLAEVGQLLAFLLQQQDAEAVYWCEIPKEFKKEQCRLAWAPLNVGNRLAETLYKKLKSAIFTSATLAVGHDFTYFIERLGLNLPDVKDRLMRPKALGSPFHWREQVMELVPSFLPQVKDGNFTREIGNLVLETCRRHRRGTLVLFTSYAMLDQVYRMLESPLQKEGITLLAQGHSGNRQQITQVFKADRSSVLLGTESFWEGVDIPGEALEILFITKLPFSVPTDPLVEAHCQRIEQNGGSGFSNFMVPEAVIKFRQGFGRLIRHRGDRGIVVICDKRVISSFWGSPFLESLPVDHFGIDSKEEFQESIGGFFR